MLFINIITMNKANTLKEFMNDKKIDSLLAKWLTKVEHKKSTFRKFCEKLDKKIW